MVEDIRKAANFEVQAALLIQKRARERGMSLAQYLDTPEGSMANNQIAAAKTETLRKMNPLGDGYAAALKANRGPASVQRPLQTPQARRPSADVESTEVDGEEDRQPEP